MPSASSIQITTQPDLDILRLPAFSQPPDNSMEDVQSPPLPPSPGAASVPA